MATTRSRRLKGLGNVGLVVAMGVVLFGGVSLLLRDTGTSDDANDGLAVGMCFESFPATDVDQLDVDQFDVVSCTEPHLAEIYAGGPLGASTAATTKAAVQSRCVERQPASVRSHLIDAKATVSYLTHGLPLSRRYFCVANFARAASRSTPIAP